MFSPSFFIIGILCYNLQEGSIKEMKKKYLISLITILSISLLLIIISLFENASDWWSLNISQTYITIVGIITNFLPFSLFEVTVIFLVLFAISLIIKFIFSLFSKNKKIILKRLYNVFLFAISIVLSYAAIAGIAYKRSKVDIIQYEGEITPALVSDTITYYLDDYNKVASSLPRDENNVVISPYSFDELSLLLQKEMDKLDSPYFYKHTGKPKSTFFSPILSELHITGINFAFTSEANVNTSMPWVDLPFTMGHELAHLKGVMREDDANLVSLYVLLNSDDPFLRYSAYFRSFSRLLEIKQLTNYKEYEYFVNQMNPYIFTDNGYYNKYFIDHDMLSKIADFMNNIYLMFNGQKEGTNSYVDKSEYDDSGKKDDDGHTIYTYTSYSPYQKLMIAHYLNMTSR